MSVKFYTRQLCIPVYPCVFYNNKAVEGSGSKGTPKYMGEGCDIWGIFRDNWLLFPCHAPSDALHLAHAHMFAYVVMT